MRIASVRTAVIFLLLWFVQVHAQTATVTVKVAVQHAGGGATGSSADSSNVVLWLTPLDTPAAMPVHENKYRLVQQHKQFHPHVLVVPVGSAVEFPNLDPFFHNVFSLYKGKRFDLGLYEAGKSRVVRFERPGVSFVFCNIHSDMSAYVIAVETPYFAVTDARGQATIPDVLAGRYQLEVWYERADSDELAKLTREVTVVGPSTFLGGIQILESEHFVPPHTNKHGEPYETEHDHY